MIKKTLFKLICMGVSVLVITTGAQAGVSLNLQDQRYDIELFLSDVNLKTVVNSLKSQTDIVFSYDVDMETLPVNSVSVKAENEPIENILDKVFSGTHVKYKLDENIITLFIEKKTEVNQPRIQQSNTKRITGTITDEKGEPVIGANVVVKGTTNGVITNMDGEFALDVPQDAFLQVSYIGYLAQEISVGNRTTFVIVLKEDTKALEEVVVIGYGKMKKGDLSAAVASVGNVDQLLDRPIMSAEEMLQGQIPGVTITSNGGHPDSNPTVTIRGMGSRNGETPLYVVDGVPGAPFNFSDVESITVLKDAASAAIYGAYAGSAGVILVTTKQAAPGRTSVEYNVVTGWAKAYNLPQSLTSMEQRAVHAVALGGEDKLEEGWNPDKNPWIRETRTDWIDEIFRTAPFQRHNVAISGGTEDFSNRASFEVTDRQGTLLNTYNKTVTVRLNSVWKVNKWIRIREDLSWRDTKKRGTNTSSAEQGAILSAMMMPRSATVYNADGSYGGVTTSDPDYIAKYGSNYGDIHGDVINPVRILTDGYDSNHTSTVTSSTFLDIMEPVKGLNFTSRFTYKVENHFRRATTTRRLEPGKPFDENSLEYWSHRAPSWDFENTLTYDRVFNRHNLGLMASTTTSDYYKREFYVKGKDFDDEDLSVMYFGQAGMFDPATDGMEKDRNVSFVGRASYSYADRYFVTASWRRDYAGRLPKGQKYGDFPSVTGAWKITSEEFFHKSAVLNLLKVRASWGRIGNLGSINMSYGDPTLSLKYVGTDVGSQVGASNPISYGKYNNTAFNPYLTWETSEQTDIGLDIGMFNDRLSVTADYFMKRTKDLIKRQDAGWTSSIGINSMLINEGEIRNSGFEFAVSWMDRVGKVNYWVNGNLATLRNRLHDIGSADQDGNKPVWTDGATYKTLEPYRSEEGRPVYSFYLVPTDGVFMTQAEIDNYVNDKGEKIQPNAQIGDLKFIDANGDGSISAEDRVFMGNAMPKVTYALSGGFTWNNFNFSMMLQGVAGSKIFNAWKYTTLNESLGNFNRSRDILKALDGPNRDVPRITTNDANKNFDTISDYYLEKGDFLRIKNISVGYTFTKLMHKWGYLADRKSTLDLTFSIDNLATFTSYSGMDPEIGSTPGSSTYSLGMDRGQYPVARTYSLALKLKF